MLSSNTVHGRQFCQIVWLVLREGVIRDDCSSISVGPVIKTEDVFDLTHNYVRFSVCIPSVYTVSLAVNRPIAQWDSH